MIHHLQMDDFAISKFITSCTFFSSAFPQHDYIFPPCLLRRFPPCQRPFITMKWSIASKSHDICRAENVPEPCSALCDPICRNRYSEVRWRKWTFAEHCQYTRAKWSNLDVAVPMPLRPGQEADRIIVIRKIIEMVSRSAECISTVNIMAVDRRHYSLET